MINKEKVSDTANMVYNGINLIFLLWFATGFQNFGYDEIRYWGPVIWLIGGILCRKIATDIPVVLLMVGMYIYSKNCDYLYHVPFEWILKMVFCPVVAYIWGKRIMQGSQRYLSKEKWIETVLWIFAIGMLLHGVLNARIWFATDVTIDRTWADVWTGKVLPATHHILYFLPFLSLTAAAVCVKWQWSVLILLVTAGCLWFQYISGSRTPFVVCGAVLAVEWLLLIVLEWKNRKKRKFLLGTVLAGVAVVLIAFLAYVCRHGGFVGTGLHHFLFVRGGGVLHNVRFTTWWKVIQQMSTYTEGGQLMDLNGLTFAHNTWLDLYNTAGLKPFIFFTAFTLYSLADVIRLCFCRDTGTRLKVMLSGMWLALFLYLAVEPVLAANIRYFMYFCFVAGIVHYELSRQKKLLLGFF